MPAGLRNAPRSAGRHQTSIADPAEGKGFQMSRYSAGVCRMMAVLKVIASAPGQSFSFVEVVRLSRVSRATAHGILLALVRDNYLTRDEEKRFSIGPAFRDIAARVGENSATAELQ